MKIWVWTRSAWGGSNHTSLPPICWMRDLNIKLLYNHVYHHFSCLFLRSYFNKNAMSLVQFLERTVVVTCPQERIPGSGFQVNGSTCLQPGLICLSSREGRHFRCFLLLCICLLAALAVGFLDHHGEAPNSPNSIGSLDTLLCSHSILGEAA